MTNPRHIRRVFLWASVTTIMLIAGPASSQTVTVVPHISIPSASPFEVFIHLDSDFQDVQGVEIKLTFDDAIVQLDGVSAGDWYTSSGLEWFFWDYTTTGTDIIHFTGALLNQGRTANGVIGICHFTALAAGTSPLDFVDVDVRNSVNQDLGAGHSTDDLIIIEEAISGERLSFGDMKYLFR